MALKSASRCMLLAHTPPHIQRDSTGSFMASSAKQDLRFFQTKSREDLEILALQACASLSIQPNRMEMISPIENAAPASNSAAPIQRSL